MCPPSFDSKYIFNSHIILFLRSMLLPRPIIFLLYDKDGERSNGALTRAAWAWPPVMLKRHIATNLPGKRKPLNAK
jgi:hypothetical protein